MEELKKVRVDKWLWSVRIFKTRTIATDAVKAGRLKINGKTAKPSQNIEAGQELHLKKDGFNLVFKVKSLIEKRVGAPIAILCYENITPEDEMNKYKLWFVETRDRGAGRPTKLDRRDLDTFKEEGEADFDWFDEDEVD